MTTAWTAGLEDVIAARSAITEIDGAVGRLSYRGYDIADLAGKVDYEDVTYLLWYGELPTAEQSREFRARLRAARQQVPPQLVAFLRMLPREAHPLDVLRSSVSIAAAFDPDARSNEPDANERKAVRLMALVPAMVGAWSRVRQGLEPVAPRADLSYAAHFLYSLNGEEPAGDVARVMDAVLVLHADHEFNASTFALRVAIATMADLHSAVVAAVATLKGPRHGGANEDVVELLREIGSPDRAEQYILSRLAARDAMSHNERADPRARIPGFGHRVYKVDDPRAKVLRGMAEEVARATGKQQMFETAERLYATMHAHTSFPVNVDFFSAVVYDALGIAPDLCTSIFATARIAGWCAHGLEQYSDNRLIRPRADYTGPAPRPMPA